MNLQEFKLKLLEKYPEERVEVLKFTSCSSYTQYKCLKCGKIYSQNRGSGILCKTMLCSCGKKKEYDQKSLELYLKNLKDKFPEQEIELLEFENTRKKVVYKCKKCNKIYSLSMGCSIFRKTTLCQNCFSHVKDSKYREIIKNFINNSKQFDFSEDWDGKIGRNSSVPIICHKCGTIQRKSASNMINSSEETMCIRCGKNGRPIFLEDFLKRMKECGKEDYEVLEFKGIRSSAKFKHSCGFVFTKTAENFLITNGCPKCYGKVSKGELKIERWLKENKVNYEKEKRFDFNLRSPFDFFLKDYNTLIEYQGEQHYRAVKFFGGEEHFQRQLANDEAKVKFCQDNGYFLVVIPYYDYNKIDDYLNQIIGSTTIPNGSSIK